MTDPLPPVPWAQWLVYAVLVGGAATLVTTAALRWTGHAAHAAVSPIAPRWMSRLVTWELALLALLAPAFWLPSPVSVLAGVVALSVNLAARRTLGQWWPSSPLRLPLALLGIAVMVSVGVTEDLAYSAGKILGITLGLCVAVALLRALTTETRLRVAVGALVLTGTGLALAGLVGAQWVDKLSGSAAAGSASLPLLYGLPGAERGLNSNAVSGVLVLLLPLQWIVLIPTARRWLWPDNGRVRWILAAAALPGLAAIFLLQSRGAWLGLGVAGALWALWSSRSGRSIGLLLLTLAVAWSGIQVAMTRDGQALSTRDGYTGSIRVELWRRGVAMVEDAPLTGVGMNMFRRRMPPLPDQFQVGLDGRGAGHDPVHAHNHLIQAALDLGVPGLLAYLAVWGVCAERLWRVVRQGPAGPKAVASALAVGLIAHFVFGVGDAIALGAKAGLVFWMVVGVAVAMPQAVGAGDQRHG